MPSELSFIPATVFRDGTPQRLDVRLDVTKRTTQQLVREFLQLKAARNEQYGNDYGRGVLECALGIVNRDEKFQGITDFCLWYHDLLKKEGHIL